MSKYECNNLSEEDWSELANESFKLQNEKNDYESITFFKDGIVCEDKFRKSDLRPLFIMKEIRPKDTLCCYFCKNQNECKRNHIFVNDGSINCINLIECSNVKECVNLWHKVAALMKIARQVKNKERYDYDPVKKSDAIELIQSLAFIHIKKFSGISSLRPRITKKDFVFKRYMQNEKCRQLLRKQIECINPTIIFCCGTFDIIKDNNLIEIEQSRMFKPKENDYVDAGYICKVKDDYKIPIVDTQHPSRISYLDFSSGVKGICRWAKKYLNE